jgi:hypothetical protein
VTHESFTQIDDVRAIRRSVARWAKAAPRCRAASIGWDCRAAICVTLDGVEVKPALALGWLGFGKTGNAGITC